MQSLLSNFPGLEPYMNFVEIATPLTLLHYRERSASLGLRHTPNCMTDLGCALIVQFVGYFTGQDNTFAGWAGALAGAMVTAQLLLGYTLLDFVQGRSLMTDLGRPNAECLLKTKIQTTTQASPLEVLIEIALNAPLPSCWKTINS